MIRFYLLLVVVFFWKTEVVFAYRAGRIWSDFINNSDLIAEARMHKIENLTMYFTMLEVFKGKPVREFQLEYAGLPGEDQADLSDPVGTTYLIFLQDPSFRIEDGVALAKPDYFFVDENFMKKTKINGLDIVDRYTYRYCLSSMPDNLFTSLKPWYQSIYEFPREEMESFNLIRPKIFLDGIGVEWEKMKEWLRKNANTKQTQSPRLTGAAIRKSTRPYLWFLRGVTILMAGSWSLILLRSHKIITGGLVASLMLLYVALIFKYPN